MPPHLVEGLEKLLELDDRKPAKKSSQKKKKGKSAFNWRDQSKVDLTLYLDARIWPFEYLKKRGGEDFVKNALNSRGGNVKQIYSFKKTHANVLKLLFDSVVEKERVHDIILEIKQLGDTFKGVSRNDLFKRKCKKDLTDKQRLHFEHNQLDMCFQNQEQFNLLLQQFQPNGLMLH